MDGVFVGKKRMIIPIIFFLCGLVFVGIAIAMNVVESADNSGWYFILLLGIAYIAGSVVAMLFNRGAYIRVAENTIQAKYHWGGRLNCSVDEVAFVLPQLNTLRIRLKNGKQHVIMGVENPWPLSNAIRRQGFVLETESPDVLRQKLDAIQAARKKELWWVIGAITFMFAEIFITVALTGARDMAEFTKTDWIWFGIMCVTETLTIIAMFYMAIRCGKHLLPMEETKHRLLGAIIASHPLPSNNIAGVYTDEHYSGRIVACGFPNDESVYYCVQQFVGNCELETIHTSEVYNSMDELPDNGFSPLIDITSAILSR